MVRFDFTNKSELTSRTTEASFFESIFGSMFPWEHPKIIELYSENDKLTWTPVGLYCGTKLEILSQYKEEAYRKLEVCVQCGKRVDTLPFENLFDLGLCPSCEEEGNAKYFPTTISKWLNPVEVPYEEPWWCV